MGEGIRSFNQLPTQLEWKPSTPSAVLSDRSALHFQTGVHNAEAEKVILVCDNLNTHTMGAFYEAFPASQARELVRRIDFRFTPKHGSWLNVSENELSSMARQCLNGRRIGDIEQLREETQAWATASNDKQRGVDWQFTVKDARNKLKSLYPCSLS